MLSMGCRMLRPNRLLPLATRALPVGHSAVGLPVGHRNLGGIVVETGKEVKKIVVHTGKPWEDKCGIARLVRVGDNFNISITAFNAPTAAEQMKGILDQMDEAIKTAGGRGVADIMITHIISNDVPKYATEIAAAHKEYMAAADALPASTITGGTFGAEWMLVEMWASGTILSEAPVVEMRSK